MAESASPRAWITGWGLGGLIAVVVLILALILAILGRLTLLDGLLFAALALARLT